MKKKKTYLTDIFSRLSVVLSEKNPRSYGQVLSIEKMGGDRYRFCATDGFLLAIAEITIGGLFYTGPDKITLPLKTVKDIIRENVDYIEVTDTGDIKFSGFSGKISMIKFPNIDLLLDRDFTHGVAKEKFLINPFYLGLVGKILADTGAVTMKVHKDGFSIMARKNPVSYTVCFAGMVDPA